MKLERTETGITTIKRWAESPLGRVIFTLLAILVYPAAFLVLYPQLGLVAAVVAILPIIASAWLWGLWVGLLAGLLALPANTLLLNLVGVEPGGWDVIIREGGGFGPLTVGSVALVLIGLVVGWLSDVMKRQLAEHKKVEMVLRGVQDELALGIQERTIDLVKANEALRLLRLMYDELELGVRERTVDLVRTNETLQAEIDERKRTEEDLAYLSHHDQLTGLANRTMFQIRLTRALARASRNRQIVGVMFMDLDRFKSISETFGHTVGDLFLKAVAKRLEGCMRDTDTVGRWGGDEFTFILEGISDIQYVTAAAERVVQTMDAPFNLEGHEVFATTSIGITVYPHDGDDMDTLTKNADAAMYRAKDRGRNNYQFYAPEMNAKALERLSLESSLRRALERDEFLIYYQPRVDINTGLVVGMEGLLRWNNAELGMVSPDQFIPLAEETGLIAPIGDWVLRSACSQTREWQREGLTSLKVSVNLSARQFRQKDLTDTVSQVLRDTGLDPDCLELELTEGVLMDDTKASSSTLSDLKALGLGISIDDFGTGYSSLSYLKLFSLDTLKIDQSFVRDITTDPDSAAIANSVIALARSLRLRVVAEGVETEEQLSFLDNQDCDEIQGYLFSPPLAANDFRKLVQSGKGLESVKET